MADKKETCIIAGAGDFYGLVAPVNIDTDIVIAADGGYAYLEQLGIVPDLWIGDFDSYDQDPAEVFKGEIITLPVVKDDTDMLAAVKEGFKRGARVFHIYGCFGGRMDHSIANIKLLSYIAEQGGRGFLYGRSEMLTVIKNSAISFPKEASGNIGIFTLGDMSQGVTIRGLKYEMTDGIIKESSSVGACNYFIGEESYVAVRNGKLLVVLN